ncbi:TPA: SDR family oxidoreductase [Candidatus Woesearchaeota archaeon]|nr:SDR family oxidoreductase [Candidatus Woesearchaeota archaeon]HIH31731.1 SDR family oxidoreductase [Candidatus Woesearchaeota archaeon]HIH54701.1 SDR family oxidoreductase [Candidatus Woesearchaeota archaeon]HIJ01430.1 SDR family oxidoreductase [Candidatus Woesearchaeota archaeon]HIJ13998.1 SDR family oxidoreductase [Candidatus Woesearchaeota archaeon]
MFKNQIAIITGGSSGIGKGIAERLSSLGAKVILVARTEDKLLKAVEDIRSSGGNAEYRIADATHPGDVEKIIDEVYINEKRLDIFVNNAGVFKFSDINTDFKEVEEIMENDMMAPGRILQYISQKFSGKEKIKILNTLSHATFRIMTGNIGYGSAKEALFRMTLQVELDLKEKKVKNIELYRLYPSSVATSQLLDLYKKGVVEAPTTLESVVNVAIDLLSDKTPSRDAFVGYVADKGILAAYYTINFNTTYNNPHVLNFLSEKIIDPKYTP